MIGDNIARRRSVRDAHSLLDQVRDVLDDYDRGAPIDETAALLALIGSRLGRLSCSGELVA
jgi:hypothetical protein